MSRLIKTANKNIVKYKDKLDEFKKTETATEIDGKNINSDIDPTSLDIAKS